MFEDESVWSQLQEWGRPQFSRVTSWLKSLANHTHRQKRQLWIWVAVLGLGLGLIVGTITYLYQSTNVTSSDKLLSSETLEISEAVASPGLDAQSLPSQLGWLYVDVSGAVEHPGLYRVRTGARVADAITAAGGLKPEADYTFITQKLNLAKLLNDSDKLFIPILEVPDLRSDLPSLSQSKVEVTSELTATDPGVSINQATLEELENLAGVGEKRANDILQNRPYADLHDLIDKGILSENLFNKLKDQLVL